MFIIKIYQCSINIIQHIHASTQSINTSLSFFSIARDVIAIIWISNKWILRIYSFWILFGISSYKYGWCYHLPPSLSLLICWDLCYLRNHCLLSLILEPVFGWMLRVFFASLYWIILACLVLVLILNTQNTGWCDYWQSWNYFLSLELD